MSKRAQRGFVLGCVCLAMGCSAVAGLGNDYTTATRSDAGATDAPAEAALPEASVPSEGSACPTDCAIPLPTGAGWSLVAYNPTDTSACPSSYPGAQETLLSVSSEPLTCQCSCKVTAPPTCAGEFHLSGAATCTPADDGDTFYTIPPTTNLGPLDGGTSPCAQAALTFQPLGTDAYSVLVELTAKAGTCEGASTPTNLAHEPSTGEACGVPTAYACACPPAVPTGWSRCAMSTSPDAVCPSGLTALTSNVGGTVQDTRACGGCGSCSVPDPQCSGASATLDFYTDTACSQGQLALTSGCSAPPKLEGTASYTASFSMSPASCTATDPTASGTVSLSGGSVVTLCCE